MKLRHLSLAILLFLIGACCMDNNSIPIPPFPPPPDLDAGLLQDAVSNKDSESDAYFFDASIDVGVPKGLEIVEISPSKLPVPTSRNLPIVSGFTVNFRIQPHGLPTKWYIEYGKDNFYGSKTPIENLSGKLAAYYSEQWENSTNGWIGGFTGNGLSKQYDQSVSKNYVRFEDTGTADNDVNHIDGIGIVHLSMWKYIGFYYGGGSPPLYLGGGFPDFRDAKLSADMRGIEWQSNGSKIGSWIQGYRNINFVDLAEFPSPGREPLRFPNWGYTGTFVLDLASKNDQWSNVQWVLENRTDKWTFAGANGGRLVYDYGELNNALSHVTVDFFPFMIINTSITNPPSGKLDFSNLTINYRQHSVLATSNGGKLVSAPAMGTGADLLTDGWRNGKGHEWKSVRNPIQPQEFQYSFSKPILITSILVHNSVTEPSKNILVFVTEDHGNTWKEIGVGDLPYVGNNTLINTSPYGPNNLFTVYNKHTLNAAGDAIWDLIYPNRVNGLKVQVLSGYQSSGWSLGEIEAFGIGAEEETDNDWYNINKDIVLEPGTYHYRLVTISKTETVVSADSIITVD